MATYDMNFDKKDEEESSDEKKKRTLPLQTYYEALEAVLEAGARLDNPGRVLDKSPPTVLITSEGGSFEVCFYRSPSHAPNDPEAVGTGATVDEAFAELIDSLQSLVEDARKKAFEGIDELLKKSNGIVRKVKAKKKDAPG